MAGERADDQVPKLHDDEEEGGESTIAMASPSFDLAGGMPSPISDPPPPLPVTPPAGVPARAGQAPATGTGVARTVAMPTAPIGFTPAGGGPASPGAAVPQLGGARAPSSPGVPTPLGGIAPTGAAPADASIAKAPGTAAAPPSSARGASVPGAPGPAARRRPQTVIGLAPPPAGAPRPGAANPLPPVSARPTLASNTGAPRPGSPSSRPSGPPPLPPPSRPLEASAPPGATKPQGDAKDDGPTMMGSTDASLAMFGLDASAADAARAAVEPLGRPAGGSAPTARSPLASTGYASPPSMAGGMNAKAPAPPASPSGEAASVSRDDLARARRVQADAPEPLLPAEEEEESTRAVPREELFRGQDAHVIVGSDAVGEDATLAVGPGDNEANNKHLAALAQTMSADPEGGFPPPPGVFPPPPGAPMPMPMGPPPSWGEPQQGWGHGIPPGPQNPMIGQGHDRPTSNPHLGSNPHLQAAHPMGGMPQSGQMPASMGMGPMGMPMHNVPRGPIPYPGQHPGGPMMHGQNAAPWGPAPGGKRVKLSNQILLLAIVGVICLAIFITGIVLFATTKL